MTVSVNKQKHLWRRNDICKGGGLIFHPDYTSYLNSVYSVLADDLCILMLCPISTISTAYNVYRFVVDFYRNISNTTKICY